MSLLTNILFKVAIIFGPGCGSGNDHDKGPAGVLAAWTVCLEPEPAPFFPVLIFLELWLSGEAAESKGEGVLSLNGVLELPALLF